MRGASASTLDPDVAVALARLQLRAVAAERITTRPSQVSRRTTLRVLLDDGRVVKVRRAARAAKALGYTRLVGELDHDRLPAVLGIEGRITVEAWIAGTSLTELRLTRRRLWAAADLLGAIHAAQHGAGRALPALHTTRRLGRATERALAELQRAGALSGAELRSLLARLRRLDPGRAAIGVTHDDLCAENLVEDARRRLFAVDNEGLALGFLDYDLFRTHELWPMSRPDWAVFLARYRRWRDPGEAVAHAPYWRIAAAAHSAHLRLTRGLPGLDAPVRGLQKLI